jgi:hypothetical protein
MEILKDMGTQLSQSRYEKLAGAKGEWEMTEEAAKIMINEWFGFEASRIRIIAEVSNYTKEGHYCKKHETYTRKPQYCATDYNYARFDVNNWFYEMINGQLYQYYC